MGFVGLLGADNAKERIQGLKDTISRIEDHAGGRPRRRHRSDQGQSATSRTRSTANPDITCMVGFYSTTPRESTRALKDAGKLKQITIIGFDEDPITLGGVKEGTIVGTVVQQPYEWGYQGMKDYGQIPGGRQILHPGQQADYRPDQDHRPVKRRSVLG